MSYNGYITYGKPLISYKENRTSLKVSRLPSSKAGAVRLNSVGLARVIVGRTTTSRAELGSVKKRISRQKIKGGNIEYLESADSLKGKSGLSLHYIYNVSFILFSLVFG